MVKTNTERENAPLRETSEREKERPHTRVRSR